MRRLNVQHAFYLTVTACSIAMATCRTQAGVAPDLPPADGRVASHPADRFDNPVDVVALVSSQIAR